MTTTKPPVHIVIMGQTGSGKSTFINLATQSDKLRVGHSITSCTSTVDIADPFELDGRQVVLLDTPGFNDTTKSEAEVLRIVASEFETQYRQECKLHGIIYMHRISDVRVGGIDKANFGIFRKLCGDKSLKNVIILTNMWSQVTKEKGEGRVRELETLDDFFKPALAKGARLMHNTEETVDSSHQIIRSIIANRPETLTIQGELVNQNMPIDKTAAGQEVDKKMAELVAKYEQKLREQIEAMEQARRERDEETRKELFEETQKAEEKIMKIEAERKSQAELYKQLQNDLAESEAARKRDIAELERKQKVEAEIRKREAEESLRREAEARKTEIEAMRRDAEERRKRDMAEFERKREMERRAEAAKQKTLVGTSMLSGRNYSIYRYDGVNGYLCIDESDMSVKTSYTGTLQEQWIFIESGEDWIVKSAYNGRNLCFYRDELHVLNNTKYKLSLTRSDGGWNDLFTIKEDGHGSMFVKIKRRN